MNVDEFAEEIRQEILSRCNEEESGHFREDKFTEVMIEYLVQAGEVDDGEVCYHKNNARGEKLNGFSLSGDGECLDLFVSSYHGAVPPEQYRTRDCTHPMVEAFLETSLAGSHRKMEESSPARDVARRFTRSEGAPRPDFSAGRRRRPQRRH
jgi:hypothetical protein